MVRATKGGSRTKLLGLFFENRSIFMGVQTIASVRDETLPVDFSRTAERGAKTFLKRKFTLRHLHVNHDFAFIFKNKIRLTSEASGSLLDHLLTFSSLLQYFSAP